MGVVANLQILRRINSSRQTLDYITLHSGMHFFLIFFSFRTPNRPDSGPVTWPQFTEREQEYLVLDVKPRVKSRYQAEKVAFWNEIVPKILELSKTEKNRTEEKAPKDEL